MMEMEGNGRRWSQLPSEEEVLRKLFENGVSLTHSSDSIHKMAFFYARTAKEFNLQGVMLKELQQEAPGEKLGVELYALTHAFCDGRKMLRPSIKIQWVKDEGGKGGNHLRVLGWDFHPLLSLTPGGKKQLTITTPCGVIQLTFDTEEEATNAQELIFGAHRDFSAMKEMLQGKGTN